ncbi:MAG: hypothetical protein AABY22_20535 [Nanoarchaeota archaeon]
MSIPKYVIIGKKDSGYRCSPRKFIDANDIADDSNIFETLNKYETFEVFNITQAIYTEKEWREKMQDYFKLLNEKQERELLNKLKNKYEATIA